MMLNKHELRYKEYIKLNKEYNEILRSKKEYVELKVPYQKGWKIYVSLRQDILNRSDSTNILKAIKLGFKEFNYVYRVYQIKKIRKKIYQEIIISFGKKIHVSYFPNRIGYKEKIFKTFSEEIRKYFIQNSHDSLYYINLPDYYYVLKSKPNIITHEVLLDPEKESRKHYIRERQWALRSYSWFSSDKRFEKRYVEKEKYKLYY
jgi:hypothetical protein